VLQKGKWVKLALESRKEVSHDTRLFRFALPSGEHLLGLPTGQHLFIKALGEDGKSVMRAYTPYGHGPGYVDFVIKVYFANVHPKFPNGGALTQIIEKLKIGDSLDFKGPMGEYIFTTELPAGVPRAPDALNTFMHTLEDTKTTFDKIGFISGGSGITPTMQVVHALLADKTRKVDISILYANQTEADILCKEQLDEVEKDPRVRVWYTVDRPKEGWKYSSGFINEEMCRDHLPAPAEKTVIFMCGPPPMLKFACYPALEKLNHAKANLHSF